MSSATPPPPAPGMALIPLPPGFTLPQFLELQGQLGMKSLFLAFFSWLIKAPSDDRHYGGGRVCHRGLGLVCFMILLLLILILTFLHSFAQLPNEIALYSNNDKKIWNQPAAWLYVILSFALTGTDLILKQFCYSSILRNPGDTSILILHVDPKSTLPGSCCDQPGWCSPGGGIFWWHFLLSCICHLEWRKTSSSRR